MQNSTCKMKNWPKRSNIPQQIIAVCRLELLPPKKKCIVYICHLGNNMIITKYTTPNSTWQGFVMVKRLYIAARIINFLDHRGIYMVSFHTDWFLCYDGQLTMHWRLRAWFADLSRPVLLPSSIIICHYSQLKYTSK